MTTTDIAALVLAARLALEALSLTLRRGTDATLETADACTALRALADAWARVLPRLPADVTPPEWPKRREGERRGPCPPDGFAALLDLWISAAARSEDVDERMANILDGYADGLRAWGREAQVCVDEIDVDDGPEQGSAGGADTEPAPPPVRCGCMVQSFLGPGDIETCAICGKVNVGAPALAHAHASMLAAELDPDAPVRCALTPIGHFAYAEPLPRGPEPVALAYRDQEMS